MKLYKKLSNGVKRKNQFINFIKGGLTVLISVLAIFTIVKAGTITPPSGTPVATFYSLSEIYNFITSSTTATEGSPALDWSATLEDSGRTLTEIYDVLKNLIVADKVKLGTTYFNVAGALVPSGGTATTTNVLSGKTYFGVSQTDWNLATGTMANNGSFALTASSSDQSVIAGYYSGGTLAGDTNLIAGNIANGINIFGVIGNLVAGYLYGSSDASKVLTSAGAGAGTYNANNLSTSTVKKGTAFDVSLTGAYSGYPGTGWVANPSGDGSTALNSTNCSTTSWVWFEDGNGDGDQTDPEDGICVRTATVTPKSWNGYDYSTSSDATYIAAYTCSGVFPNGTVVSSTYSGIDSNGNATTTWVSGTCALCEADCYDGKKDLPDQGGYTSNPGGSGGYGGPLTPEVLKNWKGTRLPTSNDFYDYCGWKDGGSNYETSCSSDTTHGGYGGMIGRTDECLDLSDTSYEWLSEQNFSSSARIAGTDACSNFSNGSVYYDPRFRAVFRP